MFTGPGLWQAGELIGVGLADCVGLGVGLSDGMEPGVGDTSALAVAEGTAVGGATAPGCPPQAVSNPTARIGPAMRDRSRRILIERGGPT
jgi:hypothetical protein